MPSSTENSSQKWEKSASVTSHRAGSAADITRTVRLSVGWSAANEPIITICNTSQPVRSSQQTTGRS